MSAAAAVVRVITRPSSSREIADHAENVQMDIAALERSMKQTIALRERCNSLSSSERATLEHIEAQLSRLGLQAVTKFAQWAKCVKDEVVASLFLLGSGSWCAHLTAARMLALHSAVVLAPHVHTVAQVIARGHAGHPCLTP